MFVSINASWEVITQQLLLICRVNNHWREVRIGSQRWDRVVMNHSRRSALKHVALNQTVKLQDSMGGIACRQMRQAKGEGYNSYKTKVRISYTVPLQFNWSDLKGHVTVTLFNQITATAPSIHQAATLGSNMKATLHGNKCEQRNCHAARPNFSATHNTVLILYHFEQGSFL